jgi:predicted MPP superfamily phosphohydrolase
MAGENIPVKKRKRRPVIIALSLFVAAIALCTLDSNTRIVGGDYELFFPNLPDAFDGYRILIVSDLHNAVFGKDNSRLIAACAAAKPDIIAVTGDLIDDAGQLPAVLPVMQSLVEIAPVYFVTGNHEWDSGEVHELLAALPDLGVTVLRNRSIELTRGGDTIVLTGLEDKNGPADMRQPDEVFARRNDAFGDKFSVTLIHRNNYLGLLSDLGTDLILCGHAHGGIIRLPFTDGLIDHPGLFPTYTNGRYTRGETTMLVSRGLGNVYGIPRLFNNPHLPVAVLRTYK